MKTTIAILMLAALACGCATMPEGWKTANVTNACVVSDAIHALAEAPITPTSEAFLSVVRMGGSAYVTARALGEDKDSASAKAQNVLEEAVKALPVDAMVYVRGLCPSAVLTDAEVYIGMIKAGAELVTADSASTETDPQPTTGASP